MFGGDCFNCGKLGREVVVNYRIYSGISRTFFT